MGDSPREPMGLTRRPPALMLPHDGVASDDQLPSSVECIAAAVSPLNPAVREKWVRRLSTGESATACSTPTALAARLAAADSRREQFRAWVMRRATARSRVRKPQRKHGSATALVFLSSPPRRPTRPVQDLSADSADSDDDGAWWCGAVHRLRCTQALRGQV